MGSKQNRPYYWHDEPGTERRSDPSSSLYDEWERAQNSTFAEPSRLDYPGTRRNHPDRTAARRREAALRMFLIVVLVASLAVTITSVIKLI